MTENQEERSSPISTSLKIGGHYYKLSALPDLMRMYHAWGRCNHILKTIDVDAGVSITELIATVIHESIEAFKEQRALNDLDHDTMINLDDGLTQLMVDNPDFFIKALTELKKERGE